MAHHVEINKIEHFVKIKKIQKKMERKIRKKYLLNSRGVHNNWGSHYYLGNNNSRES